VELYAEMERETGKKVSPVDWMCDICLELYHVPDIKEPEEELEAE
jgi:hypothetical protein